MSSDIQSALEQLQLNDYISLVIVTAVSYDYCHTFSQEVNYIWQRPWTWVSTLFLLVRYGGCLSALSLALGGTSFIPGPLEVRCSPSVSHQSFIRTLQTHGMIPVFDSCYIVYLLGNWTWSIFWAGADMVMILRVYAMYNQSRIILALLLVIYMAEVVILIVSSSIYSDSNYGTGT
ncbi:hypothetical protein OG21DRAFT_1068460 [Imleria badia]|nr:hypothetical protein OG21DRAFT_1068460 [Imleria badia]